MEVFCILLWKNRLAVGSKDDDQRIRIFEDVCRHGTQPYWYKPELTVVEKSNCQNVVEVGSSSCRLRQEYLMWTWVLALV